jgi:hypothetical protein
MFEELLPRLRDLEVTGPIARLRSNFINGIKHMPVRVELAGAEPNGEDIVPMGLRLGNPPFPPWTEVARGAPQRLDWVAKLRLGLLNPIFTSDPRRA